jgi:hypothetical protein
MGAKAMSKRLETNPAPNVIPRPQRTAWVSDSDLIQGFGTGFGAKNCTFRELPELDATGFSSGT